MSWGITLTIEGSWIKNSTIARNWAAEGGIDLKLEKGSLTFDNVLFEHNTGDIAVCLLMDFSSHSKEDSPVVVVKNSKFRYNRASEGGIM